MNSRHGTWLIVTAVIACATGVSAASRHPAPTKPYADWPAIKTSHGEDTALDARVRRIVAGMTLAQKVGQMTQAEIKSITPDEVRKYYIGSVLDGGGSWPQMNKHASIKDWLALADAYYDASMHTDMSVKIPIIWGTDAVHGDNNLFGATLFPQNVSLGAAHDVELIHEIGASTAKAVRATGVTWSFAPTLAVAQNARWGRSYESFSSQPSLVHEYARAYVEGMQGDFGPHNVMATAKHFVGDGATWLGTDQGESRVDKATMINVHGAGYFGALEAGVLSVMASYNSWNDIADHVNYGKMTGAHALLTDALKNKMGFRGFIVSDWNAIGQLPGCSNASCAQAINAGIDMAMTPDDWKAFIANTMHQVQDGEIPMARIDDAVSRIVRAKLSMTSLDKRPSQLPGAGDAGMLQDRTLARRAVRESLVLLKNNHDVLPLKRGMKLLVVGKSADNLPNQVGGWSLTWQGTDNTNADFPNAQSILSGLRDADGAANVTFSENAQGVDAKNYDAIVAVIGETPFAEMMGDIAPSSTLRFGDRFPEDVTLLRKMAQSGKPVVTVFVSGRPLFVNSLLNASDAFVMAWLPGSEGAGVADVMFAATQGKQPGNFNGTLPRPWPGVPCPDSDKAGASRWLFAPGYGLRYPTRHDLTALPEHDDVKACADASSMPVFHTLAVAPFALYLADKAQGEQAVGTDLNSEISWPSDRPLLRLRTVQLNTQQDAKAITWLGAGRFLARSVQPVDVSKLAAAHAVLQFDMVINTPAKGSVTLSMGCGSGCHASVDLGPTFAGYAVGTRQSVSIPLACFAKLGANFASVDVPFEIAADAPFAASFADIRINAVKEANRIDLSCASVGVK
ncbi:glycoside hydrolase family 3 N-terminal domain-containing protein [Rhodanobacter sp. L36]|uniref:glycoside hydrolase family 3 protein n=1 Tax=Rhodanobacter sp. L36 TaxID=1747221 RepID=UPI00131CF422|nr:glycoside hydrolase family 3 N-terminal domain-containing protein [Rhodanobacter sp. L36]